MGLGRRVTALLVFGCVLVVWLSAAGRAFGDDTPRDLPLQANLELFAGSSSRDVYSLILRDALPAAGWTSGFLPVRLSSGTFPGATLTRRAAYRGGAYSLMVEMGGIGPATVPASLPAPAGRGAVLSFRAGASGNYLDVVMFAGIGGTDGQAVPGFRDAARPANLAGISTEMGVLSGRLRVRASLAGAWPATGATDTPAWSGPRLTGVAGLSTQLDPFAGRMILDAGADLPVFDRTASDNPAGDAGYRLTLKGTLGSFGYRAEYSHPVADYVLSRGDIVRKERERYGVTTTFRALSQAVSVTLARDDLNSVGSASERTRQAYEGVVAYTYAGEGVLPVGIEYRKLQVLSTTGKARNSTRKTDEDAVSGDVRFRSGILDWGLKGRVRQKSDPEAQGGDDTEYSLAVTPAFVTADLAVTPGFTLRRSVRPASGQRLDDFAFSLGTRGRALPDRIDYEAVTGFNRLFSRSSGRAFDSISGSLRLFVPLPGFTPLGFSRFGFKSRYNVLTNPSVRRDEFSLLLTIDNG